MLLPSSHKIRCICYGNNGCQDNFCDTTGEDGRCYATRVISNQGRTHDEAGCTGEMMCRFYGSSAKIINGHYCCDTDLCNELVPNITNNHHHRPTTTTALPMDDSWPTVRAIIIVAVPIVAAILVAVFVYIWRYHYKPRRNRRRRRTSIRPDMINVISLLPGVVGGDILEKVNETSGGGSNDNNNSNARRSDGPTMQERQVAMDIALGSIIGEGSFGKVYAAKYRFDPVAVKAFSPRNVDSFWKEDKIYELLSISKHPNILSRVASSTRFNGTTNEMELWLVTELCEGGSLHQFLEFETIRNIDECLRMSFEISSGLDYLHKEMVMINSKKPAIAHRDLKPHNVLLRRNGSGYTCLLGDFGYSVVDRASFFDHTHAKNPVGDNLHNAAIQDNSTVAVTHRVLAGTLRYMAPEVLNETIGVRNFLNFKAADMYSLALVLWEIGTRTVVQGRVLPKHVVPYWDIRTSSIQPFIDIVCIRGDRPPLPPYWEVSETMNALYKMIANCWHADPNCRFTALKVQQELRILQDRESTAHTGDG